MRGKDEVLQKIEGKERGEAACERRERRGKVKEKMEGMRKGGKEREMRKSIGKGGEEGEDPIIVEGEEREMEIGIEEMRGEKSVCGGGREEGK